MRTLLYFHSTSARLFRASPVKRPLSFHPSSVLKALLATKNLRMTETMARRPPLTSRCSKQSQSVSTMVCHRFSYFPVVCSPTCPTDEIPGKFVSESKFRQNPAAFIPHIQRGETESLTALITNPEVERRLLIRLRKKAMLYAQDFAHDGEPVSSGTSKGKIDVDCVVDLYESYIIPLTKEVEVCTVVVFWFTV